MSFLSNAVSGKIKENKLIMLYGPEGVGKSTFGAQCDSPIFLAGEKGTSNLDVTRFPSPNSWDEILDMIGELVSDKSHQYKTLVIDTLDWLEPYMYDHLMSKESKKVKAIEDIGGGYGKWVNIVNNEWRNLMVGLDLLRPRMDVLVLAHSKVKTFHDPMFAEPYDRYQLKLHSQQASILWKEYVDCLLFANYEVFVKKDGMKAKAFGDGQRVVHTTRVPAYDAKNRYGLPDQLPMSAVEVMAAINSSCGESVENIVADINMYCEKINDDALLGKVKESVTNAGNNSARLIAIRSRLQLKLGE